MRGYILHVRMLFVCLHKRLCLYLERALTTYRQTRVNRARGDADVIAIVM